MARKKREEESGGNWMDTYGDMVTLLLTFFIVLYSFSTVEEDKWQDLVRAFNNKGATKVDQIVLSVSDKEGVDPGYNKGTESNFDKLFQAIEDYIIEQGMSDKVTVSKTETGEDQEGPRDDNIFLEFQDYLTFQPDTAQLSGKTSYEVLDFLGETLKAVDDDIAIIIIQGHTASYEGSQVDSRLLSTERSGVISNYFEENFDIEPKKLLPLGWANLYPIESNDSADGRAKNRRVVISIIGKDSDLAKNTDFFETLGIRVDDESYVVDQVNGKDKETTSQTEDKEN